MKFTLTADAPIEVPDVDAICLKNVKKVTISEEEPQKVLDTFAKGQLLKQDYDGLAETYEVDGLTYQYTGTFPDLEAFSFLEKYAAFDDVNEENIYCFSAFFLKTMEMQKCPLPFLFGSGEIGLFRFDGGGAGGKGISKPFNSHEHDTGSNENEQNNGHDLLCSVPAAATAGS